MSIRGEIKSGVFYNLISRYAGVTSQIFTTAVLARLLSPEDFGVAVAISTIAGFFILLSDSGFAVAIIQRKDLNNIDLYSLFIITILIGIFLGTIFWLSGPLISKFYDNNEYDKIAGYLSISLFFNSLCTVPSAILFRDKRFRAISLANLSVQISAALFAIFLAIKGFSYYSLIFQSVFQAFLKFLIQFILAPVKFYRQVSFKVVYKIFNYSIYKSLTDIFQYFAGNLDNILIGKYLGVIPLGYYDKAYKLMMLPVNNLATIVTPVLHPVLSNYQHDNETIYKVSKKITKLFGIFGIPASIFLFFSAKEIIEIFFGNQWLNSIVPFKFLALAVWIQMILSGSTSIFLSVNKSNYLFMTSILSTINLVFGIIVGIFFFKSITGVAFMILIAYSINLIQVYYYLVKKTLNRSIWDYFSSLKIGFIIGSAVLFFNLIISFFIQIENVFTLFVLKLIISLTMFVAMLVLLNEFKNLIIIIKPSKGKI